MKIEHLQHRHGGRIVEITAAAHDTWKGIASWHYIGKVQWEPNKPSRVTEIEPWAVCYDTKIDAAKSEYDAISSVLTQHLETRGHWHDSKHHRDGRVYSWSANEPKAETPIP